MFLLRNKKIIFELPSVPPLILSSAVNFSICTRVRKKKKRNEQKKKTNKKTENGGKIWKFSWIFKFAQAFSSQYSGSLCARCNPLMFEVLTG